MKRILIQAGFALSALAMPAALSAQALEGKWANPHRSVIVNVTRCGDAYCGTVGWANANNRNKGVTPGTKVLSNLKSQGDGVYKGQAYDPKRGVGGSATVHQSGPDVMVVRACAIAGLLCKEQRWTRVS